jgi:ATP-dependent HslUV protease ATP-binding subunit HslU
MSDIAAALTPSEITRRLDEYIVGQQKAKRAVAVALRNRWRRRQLGAELAADVYPKNILMMGPTGVGKTEIARRLATLARAPFLKVEATKYSEVGYHGRDVESMVRDLVEAAVQLVRAEKIKDVSARAAAAAEERIWHAVVDAAGLADYQDPRSFSGVMQSQSWRAEPTTVARGSADPLSSDDIAARDRERQRLRDDLAARRFENRVVELQVRDTRTPTLSVMGPQGNETMGIDTQALQELWGRSPGAKVKLRKLTIAEARQILQEEEADKLLDHDAIVQEALDRAQNDGIIFVDEIDKIVSSGGANGPDVSREGVQRDLLSVVEGCAVYTRYGHVRSDHMLFLAAGAFHYHKPSELIPELQGRFPVRVALTPLTEADFVRILTEPRNALTRQYVALFKTEDVELTFTPDGVQKLAAIAFRANKTTQDIGARRLMTILEKCLEDLSFDANEKRGQKVVVDGALVERRLGDAGDDAELIPYRL